MSIVIDNLIGNFNILNWNSIYIAYIEIRDISTSLPLNFLFKIVVPVNNFFYLNHIAKMCWTNISMKNGLNTNLQMYDLWWKSRKITSIIELIWLIYYFVLIHNNID